MCYTIYISTTSSEDFESLPDKLFRFETPDEESDADPLSLLRYPNRWYLSGRYGVCSCHFRHHTEQAVELGFGLPEDWYPEDDDEIESTGAAYDVFARIIAEGHRIDLLDIWYGADVTGVKSISVSLAKVPRDSFRFFENYRFELTA